MLYSQDGDSLLGTAGAIRKALPLLEENFFIMYGDSYLDCDYSAIQSHFLQQNKLGLMTVYQNNNQGDKSNIEFKNGEIIAYDKEKANDNVNHIDYGLGLFNKAVFSKKTQNVFCDLVSLYQKLLADRQLTAFQVYQTFYEIGSKTGLSIFESFLRNGEFYAR